jgi:hypothetical protein
VHSETIGVRNRRGALILGNFLIATFAFSGVAGARPADRDRDGLPDRWERRYQLSVSKRSARHDPDGDRLSNRAEYRARTNPRRGDTDRDGMRDGAEVRRGRDPRRPDGHRAPVFQPPALTPTVPTLPSPPAEPTVPSSPAEPAVPLSPAEPTVAAPPAETAATMYVDRESRGGGCSDARDASEAASPLTPWCSIERADQAAPPGALVLVRGGDYPRFALRAARPGELTLRAHSGERPVLRGGSLQFGGVRLEGFRITGTVTLETGVAQVALVGNDWITDGQTGGTNLSVKAGVREVLVEGNRIGQETGVLGGNGINFSSTDTRAAIEDVTIRGNAIGPMRGGGDAIQAKNTRRLVIEDNEIYGVSRPDGSDAHPDAIQSIYGAVDLVIRRNFIHDIAAQGVFVQEYRGENRNFRAEDNVVARVAYPWQSFAVRANASYIAHNTITGSLRVGGSATEVIGNIAKSSLTIENSQLVREDFNLSARFVATRGPNSLLGVPAFVDPAGNDFSLLPDSLGKGAGPDGSDIGSSHTVFPAR